VACACQKLKLFDFAGVGAVIAVFAVLYMSLSSRFLLPLEVRKEKEDTNSIVRVVDAAHRHYYASFTLKPNTPYVGLSLARSGLLTTRDVNFLLVKRAGRALPSSTDVVLEAGDEYVALLFCAPHTHNPSPPPLLLLLGDVTLSCVAVTGWDSEQWCRVSSVVAGLWWRASQRASPRCDATPRSRSACTAIASRTNATDVD
jgi:hypothetical protein